MRHAALLSLPLIALTSGLAACESGSTSSAAAVTSAWRPTVPLTTTSTPQTGGSHYAYAAPAAGRTTAIVTANDATFASELASAGDAAVINFTAKWCGPCKAMAPTVESLAAEQSGHVKVIRVDFDESPATVRRYSVSALPAVLVVRNGVVVKRIVGYQTRENLATAVATALP